MHLIGLLRHADISAESEHSELTSRELVWQNDCFPIFSRMAAWIKTPTQTAVNTTAETALNTTVFLWSLSDDYSAISANDGDEIVGEAEYISQKFNSHDRTYFLSCDTDKNGLRCYLEVEDRVQNQFLIITVSCDVLHARAIWVWLCS